MSDYYRTHGALTEPAGSRPRSRRRPISRVCAPSSVVIHSDLASAYGVTADLSRETLPVARRLAG
jgi:hypothetical protein